MEELRNKKTMREKGLIRFLKKNWIMIVGIVAAVLFVYSNFFFGNYQFSFTNIMYEMLPWSSSSVSTEGPLLSDVIDSAIPTLFTAIKDATIGGLWDSMVALGAPTDISSWLYPLNYLYLLPLGAASMIRSMCEFLIAFIGMFLLMKAFDCQKGVAAAAGTAYCFSSVMVMWLGWQHSDVTAFAPLAFFFFERFLTTIRVKYCFGMVIAVYLMIVAGMPTYAAYFLYLMAAYVLFRTVWIYRDRKKLILFIFAGTAASVFVAVLCSLPYTMSLLTTLSGNGYVESRGFRATQSLPAEYLHSLFFPYLRFQEDFHMNESTIYVGLISILMLFFTPFRFLKKKRMVFWCVALVIVALLIFTHTLDSVYIHLPMVNSSWKYRLIVLFNFIVIIIMGLNLNDLIVHREEYKKTRRASILALGLGAALLIGAFLFTFYYKNDVEYTGTYLCYLIIVVILTVCVGLLFFTEISAKRILVVLCITVLFDMGLFAKNYLPWIEKGNSVIPEATDTIAFLQENMSDERFGATGTWTLFPNTNVYYGLNDVRGHDFVFTNEDMKTYYLAISEENATTNTRYALIGDLNENLLKYLGVKYLVEDPGPSGTFAVPGGISQNCTLSQAYTFDEDQPQAIVMLAGTYGQEFEEGDVLYLSVTETDSGEEVYLGEYDLTAMRDNSNFIMRLDDNHLKAGVSYTLTFRTNTTEERPVTFWMDTEDSLPTAAYYNGSVIDLDLAVEVICGAAYVGDDSLCVTEMDEYTDRVELADTIEIFSDESAVLGEMSSKFAKNTAFLTEEEAEKLSSDTMGKLTDTDTAEITERSDDSVTIQVSAESSKILMLNEYYTSDWKVYVNGEEQELIKCNYLFRAVEVPAGESTVEFRYEPEIIYKMFYLAGVGWVIFVLVLAFYRKIQKRMPATRENG